MRFGSQAWIWLNAAAVGLCLCTLTGLLLLIAVRGLGHFWPADLQLYVYLDDAGRHTAGIGGASRNGDGLPPPASGVRRRP